MRLAPISPDGGSKSFARWRKLEGRAEEKDGPDDHARRQKVSNSSVKWLVLVKFFGMRSTGGGACAGWRERFLTWASYAISMDVDK